MAFRSPASVNVTITDQRAIGASFPADPVVGQQFLHTGLSGLYVWDGTSWVQIGFYGDPTDSVFSTYVRQGAGVLATTELSASTGVQAGALMVVTCNLRIDAAGTGGQAVELIPPRSPVQPTGPVPLGFGVIAHAADPLALGMWVWDPVTLSCHLATASGQTYGTAPAKTLAINDVVSATLSYPVDAT